MRQKSSQELQQKSPPQTEERDDAVIGKALKWSCAAIAAILLIAGGFFWWPRQTESTPDEKPRRNNKALLREIHAEQIPRFRFTNITKESGIRFVHENGARGEKLLPETMGGGCAFFDYNNDGKPDLLFVNSNRWPWDEKKGEQQATMVLYRNDGKGHFTDVTRGSGLDVSFYGMGVAVGDYDNDGYVDLFLTAVGGNRLFHNLGGGKFRDVSERAHVAGAKDEWSTSCGWFDYNNDGKLDLFVCNYVRWSAEFDRRQPFKLDGKQRGYGRPQVFDGTFAYLYRNDGDGRFTDVSAAAGIRITDREKKPLAKSLGVVFTDFDADGYIDIVVANDTVQNFLFRNRGNGTFAEIGVKSSIAFDNDQKPTGAMGIDVARFRNSKALGVAIGNYAHEPTALYVTQETGGRGPLFHDDSVSNGLGPLTEQELTFGVFFFDADLDGRLDLFAANGHLERDIHIVDDTQSYRQSPQLLWNAGAKQETEFLPVTPPAVPFQQEGETPAAFRKRRKTQKNATREFNGRMADFSKPMVARGAAYADIDGDGDLDIIIVGNGEPARLLRNDTPTGHHWLRVKLKGRQSNRDAIGAWVTVRLKGGRELSQQVMPTRSYLSQVELPLTFGLSENMQVKSIEIRWPNGNSSTHQSDAVDRSLTIKEPATR